MFKSLVSASSSAGTMQTQDVPPPDPSDDGANSARRLSKFNQWQSKSVVRRCLRLPGAQRLCTPTQRVEEPTPSGGYRHCTARFVFKKATAEGGKTHQTITILLTLASITGAWRCSDAMVAFYLCSTFALPRLEGRRSDRRVRGHGSGGAY